MKHIYPMNKYIIVISSIPLLVFYIFSCISPKSEVESRQISEKSEAIDFKVGEFDKTLVKEGGWVGYADKNY